MWVYPDLFVFFFKKNTPLATSFSANLYSSFTMTPCMKRKPNPNVHDEREMCAPELTPPARGPRRRDAEPERALEVAIDRTSSLSRTLGLGCRLVQSIRYCPAPAAVRRPDQRARSSRPPHPSRGRSWSRMQSTADMFEPSPNLVHCTRFFFVFSLFFRKKSRLDFKKI
jgi:hypothetical protein